MAKRNKKEEEKEEIVVKENKGTLGVIDNYAGQFFSLNQKKAAYFGIGELEDGSNKIWLSASNWCDQAPEGLTDQEANIVANALRNGTIVVGKRWLPPVDKDKQIKKQYIDLLRTSGSCDESFKSKIRNLVSHQDHGNYTAIEIIRDMIKAEKENKARPPYLTFLEDGLTHCKGPVSLVQDFPDDPDNFEVEVDPVTLKVISTTKKRKVKDNKSKEEAQGFRGFDDPVKRNSAINNALN